MSGLFVNQMSFVIKNVFFFLQVAGKKVECLSRLRESLTRQIDKYKEENEDLKFQVLTNYTLDSSATIIVGLKRLVNLVKC